MKSKSPDLILLTIIGILILFGLIMIASASIGISQENYNENYYYLKNQIFHGLIPGLVLGLAAYLIPFRFFKPLSIPLLGLSILGLIAIFIPGIGLGHGGASRWISLGPVSIQPSEFIKLSFLIYLSAWLAGKGKAVKDLSESLLPFILLVGTVAILLFLQPDIGTMGVIGFSALMVYFLAGANLSFIFYIGAGACALFVILIKFFSHASKRLQVFLHPELDPLGIGYQMNQAFLALGSGGLFGLGLGQSLQKFRYLPEPASDSIAAVIGEELGFIGLFCLIAIFIIFFIRGFRVAKNSPDQFSRLLAGGIVGWITIQAFINIAAISGLIPLTGITLPFISLGGSSLTVTLAAMGILLNISKYSKI